jgi:excisionase family DNA binding protein
MLITLIQAAEILGLHERTVRRWVSAGKMPPRIKKGRVKKFPRADIEAMVKTNTTHSTEFITLTEAAQMLGMTERTVRRWVSAGKMPPRIKKGNAKKFWRADIQALLQQR